MPTTGKTGVANQSTVRMECAAYRIWTPRNFSRTEYVTLGLICIYAMPNGETSWLTISPRRFWGPLHRGWVDKQFKGHNAVV